MVTAPSISTSETKGRAVRVTNFDVARYRHEDLLLRVNQIDDSEISL